MCRGFEQRWPTVPNNDWFTLCNVFRMEFMWRRKCRENGNSCASFARIMVGCLDLHHRLFWFSVLSCCFSLVIHPKFQNTLPGYRRSLLPTHVNRAASTRQVASEKNDLTVRCMVLSRGNSSTGWSSHISRDRQRYSALPIFTTLHKELQHLDADSCPPVLSLSCILRQRKEAHPNSSSVPVKVGNVVVIL